jgi:hypothetical protein
MDHAPAPEPEDLSVQLLWDMYHDLIHSYCEALPRPADETPDARIRRENAAISQIASLLPVNADEANLASNYFVASARSRDCYRLSRVLADSDPKRAEQLHREAGALLRTANTTRSMFNRVQANRRKREKDNATEHTDLMTEHCAIGMMAEALGRDRSTLRPPRARPEPEPSPIETADERFARLSEAEQYALIYPDRAALIRANGGLPNPCTFGPPEPAIVQALLDSG